MKRSQKLGVLGLGVVVLAGVAWAASGRTKRLELENYSDYFDLPIDEATVSCTLTHDDNGEPVYAEATLKLPTDGIFATLGLHASASVYAYNEVTEAASLPPDELCYAIEDLKAEAAANGGKMRLLVKKELGYDREPGSYGNYCHRSIRELLSVHLPRGVVMLSSFEHQLTSAPLSDCQ